MEFFKGQPCWVDIMVTDADKQSVSPPSSVVSSTCAPLIFGAFALFHRWDACERA